MPSDSQPNTSLALGSHPLDQSGGSHNNPDESLSPLEQEVLNEYARLLGNLNNVSSLFLFSPCVTLRNH
jgi:DASH complex subunit DAD3